MVEWESSRRYQAVMRQCRAIEKQAASLRGGLLWLAGGEGGRVRVDKSLRALREQLAQVEALADGYCDAASRQDAA